MYKETKYSVAIKTFIKANILKITNSTFGIKLVYSK